MLLLLPSTVLLHIIGTSRVFFTKILLFVDCVAFNERGLVVVCRFNFCFCHHWLCFQSIDDDNAPCNSIAKAMPTRIEHKNIKKKTETTRTGASPGTLFIDYSDISRNTHSILHELELVHWTFRDFLPLLLLLQRRLVPLLLFTLDIHFSFIEHSFLRNLYVLSVMAPYKYDHRGKKWIEIRAAASTSM